MRRLPPRLLQKPNKRRPDAVRLAPGTLLWSLIICLLPTANRVGYFYIFLILLLIIMSEFSIVCLLLNHSFFDV